MTKSNNRNTIDQQYLRSMNIDLWVARDAPVPTDNAAQRLNTESQTDNVEANALAHLSAAQLGAALGKLCVTTNSQVQSAELLVVTEDSTLSDACLELLGSMLKAIELNDSQWLHAGIVQTSTGVSLNTLGESIPLKAVVLMLLTGGNTNALGQLRMVRHQVPGFQPPVMVTFHPQELLDNTDAKRPAWEDLKQLRKWLG